MESKKSEKVEKHEKLMCVNCVCVYVYVLQFDKNCYLTGLKPPWPQIIIYLKKAAKGHYNQVRENKGREKWHTSYGRAKNNTVVKKSAN